MNTFLFPVLFLFVGNHSFAQSAGDTTQTKERTCSSVKDSMRVQVRARATFYYIDGVKVQGSVPDSTQPIEEVQVITGGLPEPYGNLNSGIIPRPTVTVPPLVPSPRDKKENLQTE